MELDTPTIRRARLLTKLKEPETPLCPLSRNAGEYHCVVGWAQILFDVSDDLSSNPYHRTARLLALPQDHLLSLSFDDAWSIGGREAAIQAIENLFHSYPIAEEPPLGP